jgi:hypothetical protein
MTVNLLLLGHFRFFVITRATFGFLPMAHDFLSECLSRFFVELSLFSQGPLFLFNVSIGCRVLMVLFENLRQIRFMFSLLSVNRQVVVSLLVRNK